MKILNAEGKNDEGFWLISCPKEEKKVPDYHCLGSFVRGTETCGHLQSGSVGPEGAQMKCHYPEKVEGHHFFTVRGPFSAELGGRRK